MAEKISLLSWNFYSLFFAACLLALSFTTEASSWAEIEMPAAGPARAIGSSSNGCLAGAGVLPEQGSGYVSIRRNRNRYYGHPALLQLIEKLGNTVSQTKSRLMMIGDLSQPRGGLMSSAHRSHQNGLDVDIWFTFVSSAKVANETYPDGSDPQSMVAPNGLDVTSAWGQAQRFLIKAAAEDDQVDRVFVNPAIKQMLCETVRGKRTWLRKLRPWRGHDAHFHVRIKCPQGNMDCEQQAPLPAGDGCGEELAWWFSDEARTPKPSKSSKSVAPKPASVLPETCKDLLSGS